jgi:hypothetical protein
MSVLGLFSPFGPASVYVGPQLIANEQHCGHLPGNSSADMYAWCPDRVSQGQHVREAKWCARSFCMHAIRMKDELVGSMP